MVDADVAIRIIDNYILKLKNSDNSTYKYALELVSFSKWAAMELKDAILDYCSSYSMLQRGVDVNDVLDNFILKMDYFLTIKYSKAFEIAIAVAQEIKFYLKREFTKRSY